jgi:hypothetical protein
MQTNMIRTGIWIRIWESSLYIYGPCALEISQSTSLLASKVTVIIRCSECHPENLSTIIVMHSHCTQELLKGQYCSLPTPAVLSIIHHCLFVPTPIFMLRDIPTVITIRSVWPNRCKPAWYESIHHVINPPGMKHSPVQYMHLQLYHILVITETRLSRFECRILRSRVKEDGYTVWSSGEMRLAEQNAASPRRWNAAKVATRPQLQNSAVEAPV